MASGTIKNLSSHHNFSAVPTDVLANNKLSASAKGMLAFLLSLPKNHSIEKRDLPNYFTEGYYALNTAFEELIKRRFIHRIELRNKKGHFKGFEYRVYDVPTRRNGDKKVLPNSNYRKSDSQESVDGLLNQIHNEDCLITMNKMPDQCIDLVLTSPPYDDVRKYNGNHKFSFERVAIELTRVIKPGGIIIWIVGDGTIRGSESGAAFRQAIYFIDSCRLKLHDTMLYIKNTSTFPARRSGKRYSQIFEYVFVLSKGTPATANLICDKPNRWSGTTNFASKKTDRDKNDNLVAKKKFKPIPDFSPRTNAWRYVTGKGFSGTDDIAYKHPAVSPEPLIRDHTITWSNEGNVVYDPFLGSGSVAKVAQQLGRFWIGSEVVSEYCRIAESRLEH